MKICTRCKLEKGESGFPKDKNRKDGLYPNCKLCKGLDSKKYNKNNRENCAEKLRKWREKNPHKNKEYSAIHREKNRDKIVARRSRPEAREKMKILVKNWQEKNKERVREARRKWKRENRFTENARSLVAKAIRRGKIKRPSKCERCKKECTPDAHHHDYSKPLEVHWLCKICHMKNHGKLKDIEFAEPIANASHPDTI